MKRILACSSWFGHSFPANQRIALIAESEFDAVGLWLDDDLSDYFACRDAARHFSLGMAYAHACYMTSDRLWSSEVRERVEAQSRLCTWLEILANDKVPLMVLHAGGRNCVWSDAGQQAIQDIVRTGKEIGVGVALENTTESAWLCRVMDAIPDALFCFDTGHAHCDLPYPSELSLLDRYISRLACLHVHDNDGSEDQHLFPGEGSFNFNGLFERLVTTNSVITSEITGTQSPSLQANPLAFLQAIKATLCALFY